MNVEKSRFIVRNDGWVAGTWHLQGDVILLSASQAKYENVDPAPVEGTKARKATD